MERGLNRVRFTPGFDGSALVRSDTKIRSITHFAGRKVAVMKLQFFEARCHECGRKFVMPLLGDFSYGQFIFHGEKGKVFGYLLALENLAWDDITTRLRQAGVFTNSRKSEEIDRLHQVIAASADAISEQRLTSLPVCPICYSRSIAYGDSTPLEVREVPLVTFDEYRSSPATSRTRKLLELWKSL